MWCFGGDIDFGGECGDVDELDVVEHIDEAGEEASGGDGDLEDNGDEVVDADESKRFLRFIGGGDILLLLLDVLLLSIILVCSLILLLSCDSLLLLL